MKNVLIFILLACASFSAMAGQCFYAFEHPLSSKIESIIFVNACDKNVEIIHWCSDQPSDKERWYDRKPRVVVSTICETGARFSWKEKHDPSLGVSRPSIDWIIEILENRPGSEKWSEEKKKEWRKYVPVTDVPIVTQ